MSGQEPPLWVITGVSSGLGRALAIEVLAQGGRAVGTVRREADLAAFEALAPGRAFGRRLDVTDVDEVARTIADIEARVGPIEILVNNAGYGCEGALEEVSLDDARAQFDANLFGPLAAIQAVLPHMRRRRRGRILNISSMTGWIGVPGLGLYCASKFALEGMSEALAREVQPFGIHVTAVAPGSFRTDWAGRSLSKREPSDPDYVALLGPMLAARAERDGAQPGDPARLARALVEIARSDDPPIHFVVGTDAVPAARRKLETLQADIDRWEALALSTDYV